MSFYQHAPDLVDDIHRGRTRSISPTYSETESVKSFPARYAPRVRFDLTPPPSLRRRASPSPGRHRHCSSRSHPRSFTPPPFTSTEDQVPIRGYPNGHHHHQQYPNHNPQYHHYNYEGYNNDRNEHRELVLGRPAGQQMMNTSELEPLDDGRMVLRNQHAADSFNHNGHDEWALANTPGMEVNMECRRGYERNCALTAPLHLQCGFPGADQMWRSRCNTQHSIHCHRRYGRCGCPCVCNVNVNIYNNSGNQINHGAPPAYPGIQQPPVILCGGACGRGPHQIIPGTGGTSVFYAGGCPVIITNCGDTKQQKQVKKTTEIICLGDVLTTETKGRIKVRVPKRKTEANVNCSIM